MRFRTNLIRANLYVHAWTIPTYQILCERADWVRFVRTYTLTYENNPNLSGLSEFVRPVIVRFRTKQIRIQCARGLRPVLLVLGKSEFSESGFWNIELLSYHFIYILPQRQSCYSFCNMSHDECTIIIRNMYKPHEEIRKINQWHICLISTSLNVNISIKIQW